MHWKLLAYDDEGPYLDSAAILYLDAEIWGADGNELLRHVDKAFRASNDSLWFWLLTRHVGDSLELLRSKRDFLTQGLPERDTLIYRLMVTQMRTKAQLGLARTTENLYLDTLIRTDSIRGLYREVDGVYMQTLETGDTLKPVVEGKEVVVHYRGSLTNGTVFDDSRRMTGPLRFVYGNEDQVIEGLDKALSRMYLGGVARVVIPSRLAFGDRGTANGTVPPYQTVIYRLEVVELGE